MGDTDRINALEKEVDALKNIINGEGMEDGMKTTVAKTDQMLKELKDSVGKIHSGINGLAMIMAAGILTMIFEAIKNEYASFAWPVEP